MLFKKFISLAVLFLFLIVPVFIQAADNYNVKPTSTNGKTDESYDEVFLLFSPSMATDSTGSFHSQPLYIGNMNDNDAFIYAIANAGTDHNFIFHYSDDRQRWVATTATGLDLVTNTGRYDTLGAGDQGAFHKWQWLVIEDDGQAGANTTDIVYLYIVFQKDALLINSLGGLLPKIWWFEPTSITNP